MDELKNAMRGKMTKNLDGMVKRTGFSFHNEDPRMPFTIEVPTSLA